MGPSIAIVFPSITNKMQRYTLYLFLHVSGSSSAHHQELSTVLYSIGYFVKPLLISATVVEELEFVYLLFVLLRKVY